MKITLQGGPADGRTFEFEHMDFAVICVPAPFGWERPPWERGPMRDLVFYVHEYNARTGIWTRGKMPNDTPAIPWRFTLFSPRLERLLAWIDKKRA